MLGNGMFAICFRVGFVQFFDGRRGEPDGSSGGDAPRYEGELAG
jgi:hypothetical protein